ncbi:MAG TPA: substrate-binding domain-containing protein, partial [Terracidiphilus sp.]|nr:substrate-binding domain-containing protein [Terracidiphilus sp.]
KGGVLLPKAKIKRLYLIPILSKALDVLELLEQMNEPIALEDVFQRTHISKTSVYRILKTLVHRGYVAQSPSGLYRLVSRPRRLRFGLAVQSAEMPFSVAVAQSVTAAAAAAGVEIFLLDNRQDPDAAIRNARELVERRIDLALEFQVEESVAPHVAHIFKQAEIPLVAIDVPHPNATYFGVDNFEVGYVAGECLARHAQRTWHGRVDWILGVGFSEAGSFVEGRITGAFEGIRQKLPELSTDRYVRLEGRGMREPSRTAIAAFLRGRAKGQRILVATATDLSALGVLDAALDTGRNAEFAIVGQDCIPEVLGHLRAGKSAIVGSVSHEVETYGPRLIQLGISLLRGHTVPPYNYVRHRLVTTETLADTAAKAGQRTPRADNA